MVPIGRCRGCLVRRLRALCESIDVGRGNKGARNLEEGKGRANVPAKSFTLRTANFPSARSIFAISLGQKVLRLSHSNMP